MIQKWFLVIFGVFICGHLWVPVLNAERMALPKQRVHSYTDGKVLLEGFFAEPNFPDKDGRVAGILVCHQWKGISGHELGILTRLAELGFVAFAVDIYGKDKRAKDNTEAAGFAGGFYSDRELLSKRVNLGLQELRSHPRVDPKKILAIGYCFGGTTVLDLARSGADVAGVVSFHGGLSHPNLEGKKIKCPVLVLHGADDPYVKKEEIDRFHEEMRRGKVDWAMFSFGNSVHAFTQLSAGSDNSKGAAYNSLADRRSWECFLNFIKELFPDWREPGRGTKGRRF